MNDQSWLEWRKTGLGASDAPIVMGVSPWTTPHQLWEYKTGKSIRQDSNWATRRGNEMEPRARAYLELQLNLDFPPILVEHPQFPFMKASLDGWNQALKVGLEIKCPGREDHESAANEQIPEKYYPQVQHQMFVTGASKWLYFSYHEDINKNATGFIVDVYPDPEYQKLLFDKMCKFWKHVQENKEPELTDKDFRSVRNTEVRELLDAWKETKNSIDVLSKRLDNLKEQILNHADVKDRRVRCGNYRISIVHRMGNVQYKDIPHLKGVDLDKYRASPTIYQTIDYKEDKNDARNIESKD